MRHKHPVVLSSWLFFIAGVQIVLIFALYRFFVLTRTGQSLDTIALASNGLGAEHLAGPVSRVLEAISIAAVAVATCIIGFIALIRERIALAVTSVVLVCGANLTAELLKHYLNRPDLGIDEARAGAGNSFPSGHTAIAASVVVALVMVLPPAARGIGAVIGSLYVAVVGVATMSAGWHRPSDAGAAILVVGVWAALAGVLLRYLRRRGERVDDGESHKVAFAILAIAGLVALGVALAGMEATYDVIGAAVNSASDGAISTKRQAAAYAGSAAGILATSCLVIAIILLTVHRIVPKRTPVTRRPPRASGRPTPWKSGRAAKATGIAARSIGLEPPERTTVDLTPDA